MSLATRLAVAALFATTFVVAAGAKPRWHMSPQESAAIERVYRAAERADARLAALSKQPATTQQRFWIVHSRHVIGLTELTLEGIRSSRETSEVAELVRREMGLNQIMAAISQFAPTEDPPQDGPQTDGKLVTPGIGPDGPQTDGKPVPPGTGHSIADIFNPLHTSMSDALDLFDSDGNFKNPMPRSRTPQRRSGMMIQTFKINPRVLVETDPWDTQEYNEIQEHMHLEEPHDDCAGHPHSPGCGDGSSINSLSSPNGNGPMPSHEPEMVQKVIGHTPAQSIFHTPGGRPAGPDSTSGVATPHNGSGSWVGKVGPADQPIVQKLNTHVDPHRAALMRQHVLNKQCPDCGLPSRDPNTSAPSKAGSAPAIPPMPGAGPLSPTAPGRH